LDRLRDGTDLDGVNALVECEWVENITGEEWLGAAQWERGNMGETPLHANISKVTDPTLY
jgi:hypothetical protein